MKSKFVRNLKESYDYIYSDNINNFSALNVQENIDKITGALQKSQKEIEEMRFLLEAYHEREQLIIQILITAQIHAQRIELEARRKARDMLGKCEFDLRLKKEQLARLRNELNSIKEKYKDVLMAYSN